MVDNLSQMTPILAYVVDKAETQAADASVLSFTPPLAKGMYEVMIVCNVSSATAGIIGFQISYKDSNGKTVTNQPISLTQGGTAAPALTFTTSAISQYFADVVIEVDNSQTAIIINWVGGGTTVALVSISLQRMLPIV